jgi:hypothetical protein
MLGPHLVVVMVPLAPGVDRSRVEALAERPADREVSCSDGARLCFDFRPFSGLADLFQGKLQLFDIRSELLVCL